MIHHLCWPAYIIFLFKKVLSFDNQSGTFCCSCLWLAMPWSESSSDPEERLLVDDVVADTANSAAQSSSAGAAHAAHGWGADSDDSTEQVPELPEAEEEVEQPLEGQTHVPSKRTAGGRRKGTFGNPMMRAFLREANAVPDGPAAPLPGSIEAARLALAKQRAVQQQQQKQQAGSGHEMLAVCESPDFSSSIMSRLANLGSPLQQCLVNTFGAVQRASVITTPDELLGFFLRCQSLTTSAKAVAEFYGTTRQHVTRLLLATACAILHSAAWLWGLALAMLARLWTDNDAEWEPLLCFVKVLYDETPSKVRVIATPHVTWFSPNGGKSPEQFLKGADLALFREMTGGSETGLQAKVLQTKLSMGFLLQHKKKDSFAFFYGNVPTSLQVLDRTTAENTRAAVWDSISDARLHDVFFCMGFMSQEPSTC